MLFETGGNQGEWLRGMLPRTAGPLIKQQFGLKVGHHRNMM